MPTVPPNTLNDLPKSVRREAQRLLFERSVLGYAFSFEQLEKHMSVADIQKCVISWKDDELKSVKSDINDRLTSIYTENGIDKTLRDTDPFGRPKDYIMMEGTTVSFSQNRALEIAVAGVYRWKCKECEAVNYTRTDKNVQCPSCTDSATAKYDAEKLRNPKAKRDEVRIYARAPLAVLIPFDAEALSAVFHLATTRSTYVTMQARDVAEDGAEKKRRRS